MLKIPAEYDRDTSLQKITGFSPFLPASVLGVCTGICQMVDDSGMITTQMGTHNRSEYGRSACDALIPHRNSNQSPVFSLDY
jgi:hypothetical protein